MLLKRKNPILLKRYQDKKWRRANGLINNFYQGERKNWLKINKRRREERTLIGKALAKKKCNWKTFFFTFSEFSLHFWLSYYHILHNDYRYVLCMSDICFYWKNDWLILWTFHKVEFYSIIFRKSSKNITW